MQLTTLTYHGSNNCIKSDCNLNIGGGHCVTVRQLQKTADLVSWHSTLNSDFERRFVLSLTRAFFIFLAPPRL
jgi:hypothetical protein